MNILIHKNILRVYEMHTVYIEKKNQKQHTKSGSDSDSGLDLDDDMLEAGEEHCDIIIIMDKADYTLKQYIYKRRNLKKPFST